MLLAHTKRCTRSSESQAPVRLLRLCRPCHSDVLIIAFADIAKISRKVITFYKQKGGEVVSPLVKAF